MKTLVGGAVASVFGLIGLSIWFGALLQLLAGVLPIMFLLVGAFALYLGFDELKDRWNSDEKDIDGGETQDLDSNDKYKSEITKLKGEIKELKSKKN